MWSKSDEEGVVPVETTGTQDAKDVTSQMAQSTRDGGEYPPQPPSGRGAKSGNGGKYEKNQKILLVLGVAILAVVVIAASFALGYVVGKPKAGAPGPAGQGRRNPGGLKNPEGKVPGGGVGGELRQQFGKLIESGEASLVRGKIAAVENGDVTVETPGGDQTVSLTESTKYLRAGALEGGNVGASSLAVGEQVLVIAQKGANDKLEAIAVRVGVGGGRLQKGPGR
jgi:hypothetical protein